MSLSSYENKVIASLIREAENNVINQAINENIQYSLSLDQIDDSPYTLPPYITCSCMCKNCGTGPLAPGTNGNTEYCASCRR